MKAIKCFSEVGINEVVDWIEIVDDKNQVQLRINLKPEQVELGLELVKRFNTHEVLMNIACRAHDLETDTSSKELINNIVASYKNRPAEEN